VDSGSRRQRSFRQDGGSALDDLIFRLRARRILRQFPPYAAVAADLGCGHDYRLLRHLYRSRRIGAGIAVDLALGQPPPPGITLIETDLGRPLEIASASVSVVMSLAVLEHLDDPGLHLREAYRVLRSPGLLLLTSPSRASRPLLEFMAYRLHIIDAEEIRDHRHYFNEAEIRSLLVDSGFSASTVEYRTFLLGLNQFASAAK
jgi:SAM-dependent methyltransferase